MPRVNGKYVSPAWTDNAAPAINAAELNDMGQSLALAAVSFGPVVVTVAVGSWSGSGPWTQTVSVAGVTAADNGIGVYPVDVADDDARGLYNDAYGCLAAEAETVAGGIKLTCREKKPETSFQIKVQGVR